jgi:hypothetical protein
VLPMLAGSGIALLVPFPENIVPNSVAFLCCAVILLVAFIRTMTMGPIKIPKQSHWEKWPIVPTIILAAVLVLYRVVLSFGLQIPNPNFIFGGS